MKYLFLLFLVSFSSMGSDTLVNKLINLRCENGKNFEPSFAESQDRSSLRLHNFIVSSDHRAHIKISDKIQIDIIDSNDGSKLFSASPSYQRVYCSTDSDSDCLEGSRTFYFSFEVQGNNTDCFFSVVSDSREISSIF